MMNRVIVPPGGKSEEDKAFYKLALKIQEENPLPDHCTKETYIAKANAYINYIRPNLPYVVEVLDALPATGGSGARTRSTHLTRRSSTPEPTRIGERFARLAGTVSSSVVPSYRRDAFGRSASR